MRLKAAICLLLVTIAAAATSLPAFAMPAFRARTTAAKYECGDPFYVCLDYMLNVDGLSWSDALGWCSAYGWYYFGPGSPLNSCVTA